MNTTIAELNTVRAPSRSASQPESGMKMPRLSRYAVIARLSRSGLSPNAFAIVGSAVAITVASMFSMNSAQATIIGTR